MNYRIFLLSVFVVLFVIMFSGNVLAAQVGNLNITAPTNGTNQTSIAFFNVTFSNGTGSTISNPTVAQFFYNTSNIGTWAVIGNLTTCYYQDATNGECRGNISISAVPDGIYSINVTMWNATGNVSGMNATLSPWRVTFDSTPAQIYINFTGAGQFPNGLNSTAMNFTFNYSVADLGINTCWWSNNSGLSNQTLVNCGTNASLNWTNPGPGIQTITIYVNNSVGLINSTYIVHGVSNQTPIIELPSTPLNGGNYSGTIVLRVRITDQIGVNAVFFNITNVTSGTGNGSNNATRDGSTDYWYFSLNTANLAEGRYYNISIWANNSVGLINSTHNSSTVYKVTNITFDNTVPSVPVLSDSSVTSSTISATITVSDALSGIGTSCGISRAGATVSGTTGTQTFSETGLSCGSTKEYIATCHDLAGNTATSIVYSYTTTSCSSGSSSGGGGGGGTPTGTTYIPQANVLGSSEGYTQQLASNDKVEVPVGTETHYVAIQSLTSSEATIQISSNPVQINLKAGEESKVDVNSDGFYDIYVILNSIANNKADVTIRTINESIPAGEGAVSNTGTGTNNESNTPASSTGSSQKWIWIAAVIAIIIVIVVISLSNVSKKKRYMLYGY